MKARIAAVSIAVAAAAVFIVNVNRADANALPVGEPAPAFTLTDSRGNTHSLADYRGNYVVLEWINHGCPFVVKHYDTGNMQALQNEAAENDVIWLSICSSAEGTQGHMSAADWNRVNEEKEVLAAGVLIDEDGEVGRRYDAKTTPHMYIIDPDGVLIYRGAIDDKPTARLADVEGAHNFVRAALNEAMAGQPVSRPVTEPYGCTIKYK